MEEIRSLVMRERQQALSNREWKHRLQGYGYTMDETTDGFVIKTLPHGVAVLTV